MTSFETVGLYIAIFLIMNIILMYRVGQVRLAKKINLGDGGDELALARIRAHGNFSETVPLLLLGLIAMAMLNAPFWSLHLVGAGLVIGRVLHAMGMAKAYNHGRLVGTLTFMLLSLFTVVMIAIKIIAG